MKTMPIIKYKYFYLIPSVLFLVVGIIFFCFKGFNTGIDFSAGINLRVQIEKASINEVRDALSSLSGINIQEVGTDSSFAIKQKALSSQEETEKRIIDSLNLKFDSVQILQSEFVGPKFSADLLRTSIMAVFLAVILIFIYICFRFRSSYAISSIIALSHDVLLMLAFIIVFRLEVSTTTIAAVLTIIGYSLNNTIVIFDRIRENINAKQRQNIDLVIENSVCQSLTRTIITSITTLFAVIPLAIFASGTIRLFAINLIWGIIVGGYSSCFLAPIMLHFFHKVKPINIAKKKKVITDLDYIK